MLTIWQIPIEKVLSFLPLSDRIELASSNKILQSQVKSSLTPQYDMEIAYLSCRSRILRPKKSKKSTSLPELEIKGQHYSMIEEPIYSIPHILKQIPYTFETTADGCSIFSNKFGDKMVVHSSLLESFENPSEKYTCLENADDLNEGVDFSNPAMLLRRQRLLLEKISKSKAEDEENKRIETLKHIREWGDVVIILCHGGNFNIAGFKSNGSCMKTSSDHKYVTRKKQGGRQSGADKKSGAFHSKGASIRRENEKKHAENIDSIVEESRDILERASLIFLHAPGNNYFTFIGENGVLDKWKDKVRPVGITTNKAKFQETERVFKEISTIKILFKLN